jgi:hypothetical protein
LFLLFVLLYEIYFNYPNEDTIPAMDCEVDVFAKRCPIEFDVVNEVTA